jgi:uncharacterized protein
MNPGGEREMFEGMRLAPFSLLLGLALVPAAQATSVNAVPDARPQSAVVDLTGTLSEQDKQSIQADAERGRSGGELYVAVIDTTDGEPPRSYATRLFNRLALDTKTRNRGVLLMAALSDRKAEIIVGDGYAGSVTAVTDRIMSNVVVANFRQRNPQGAMVKGARELVDQVLLAAPSRGAASETPASGGTTQASTAQPYRNPPSRSDSASAPSEPPGLWQQVENVADRNPLPFWGGLGGTGLLAFVGTRRYLRYRPRKCGNCQQRMVLLGEAEDDEHLTSSERKEESLGSVDYDIWMCPDCESTLKLDYGALFTRYSKCKQCKAKTLHTSTTTISPATEYSTGLARVEEDCRHCSYRNSYTRTIPRKPRSTSSSSSSSSRSSSSSSRGGGSSSGRGSSGSW